MCSVTLAVVEWVVVGVRCGESIPIVADEVVTILDDAVLLVAKASAKGRVGVVDACVYNSNADALSGLWAVTVSRQTCNVKNGVP